MDAPSARSCPSVVGVLLLAGLLLLLVSVLALLAGLADVSAEKARTAQAHDEARANLARARSAENDARANRAVAKQNLLLAMKAVNEAFDVAKEHPLLQRPGMHEV